MVILKTKSKHNVPFERGIVNTEVYLKISDFNIDENGVVPHGFYYIKLEGQESEHVLDHIVPSVLFWSEIEVAETQLSQFQSNSLRDAIHQRVTEFAFAKLYIEGTENYGIDPTDWEVYQETFVDSEDVDNEDEEGTIIT